MEMIWCPPSGYVRGEGDEAHQVILTKGFYMGKFEVTQEEYEKVIGTNPSNFKGEKLPVEQVSWNDAEAFLRGIKQERTDFSRLGVYFAYRGTVGVRLPGRYYHVLLVGK